MALPELLARVQAIAFRLGAGFVGRVWLEPGFGTPLVGSIL
jgi:hypothetical protein